MYVPLWLVVTIAYVAILAVCMWFASREEILGCFGVLAVTIVYLLFWVAYLALTG